MKKVSREIELILAVTITAGILAYISIISYI